MSCFQEIEKYEDFYQQIEKYEDFYHKNTAGSSKINILIEVGE